ncbi:hypothetical protein C0Q70_04657 [Pomacea canaliculata]|uniref:SOCS box domain-containing protein n=1 Tax=Pomacea canaliculata TaxID=400727 RepID=A0A2T7PIZ4_POMCA|nr:hypothetical protein C0Q70_04657 [Pomacea canaliculata]
MDDLIPCDMDVDVSDEDGDTAIISAARCENWKVVSLLMSELVVLPDKDIVIAFLQILGRSEYMNKNCGLSANILCLLWENFKKTIPECDHKAIHNILILVAAKVNCWWLVHELLTTDIELNTLDEDGMGLVHRLAKGQTNKHISLLLRVIEKGGDINLKNVDGDTAAHVAVKSQNWEMINDLLDKGASINIVNKNNHTFLHLLALCSPLNIACCGNIDVIFKLLQKSSLNVDTRDSKGNTALHLAVKEGNNLVAEKLLTLGARCDLLDENGRTVLHSLVMQQNAVFTSSLLKKAIESGPSLATKDSEGNTAVHVAAKLKKWEYVNLLLAHGASDTEPDREGWTVIDRVVTNETSPSWVYSTRSFEGFSLCQQLHLAVRLGQWNFVGKVVKNGVNVNSPDRLGFTVLQKLVQLEWNKTIDGILRLLVNRRADVNVRTPAGDNLLQLAAKHQNWSVIRWLLNKNFSVYEPDSEGFCVLQRLAEDRAKDYQAHFHFFKKDTVTFFRDLNGDTLLQLAAKHKNIPVVEYLIQQKSFGNINQLDSEGFSVLHRIVQYKSEFSESRQDYMMLLEKGARLFVRNKSGDTVLHVAAKHGNWVVVSHLIDEGADVNELDSEGFHILQRPAKEPEDMEMILAKDLNLDLNCPNIGMALKMGVKQQQWNFAKQLVELGTDVKKLDFNVLYLIATQKIDDGRENCTAFINLLLMKGADVTARCPRGDSVFHLAARHDNWEIIEQIFAQRTGGLENVDEPDSEGFTILHRLATSNRGEHFIRILQFLLDNGAKCDKLCPSGDSVMHLAVKHNNWYVIEELLSRKTKSLLVSSAQNKRLKVEHNSQTDQQYLKKRERRKGSKTGKRQIKGFMGKSIRVAFNINAKDADGNTVLHLSIKTKKWSHVYRLLMCGADVSLPDNEGHTAFYWMAAVHDEMVNDPSMCSVLEIFRERAPGTTERDEFGETLIQVAARNKNVENSLRNTSERKLPLVKLMVTTGAKIYKRYKNGLTAQQLALSEREWEVLQFFLKSERKKFWKKRKLVFHELAKDTRVDVQRAKSVTQQLLTIGYNINECEKQGDTPLNLAANYGNWKVVSVFLNHGADASIPDSEGYFVCHRLALDYRTARLSVERLSSILLLLKKNGFDVNQTGPDGKSCAQLAIERKRWALLWHLVECGAKCCFTLREKKITLKNMFRIARNTKDEKTLKSLILHLMEKDDDSCQTLAKRELASLKVSVLHSNWAAARMLVECGVDIRVNDGSTLMMHSLISKYRHCDHMMWLSFLDTLLARGADINSRDKYGKTLLFQICAQHCQDGFDLLIHSLLDRGANPLLADSTGKSVLRCILDLEKSLVLKALVLIIQLGVSTYQPTLTETAKNLDYVMGLEASPTQEALKKKNVKVLEMLVESGASSNRELFELSTQYQVQLSSEDMTGDETQMLDILKRAASQPRSLKSLCRLTVSHTLGCGVRRIDRVKSLPLQDTLQDYMLFSDLLSLYSQSKESNMSENSLSDDYEQHNYFHRGYSYDLDYNYRRRFYYNY